MAHHFVGMFSISKQFDRSLLTSSAARLVRTRFAAAATNIQANKDCVITITAYTLDNGKLK
jgi:hypothetical protein